MSLSKLWETVKDTEAWRAAVHGVTKSRTRQSDRRAATGYVGLTPEPAGPPGEEMAAIPLFCLGYPRDRGARWAAVPGLEESWARLSTHTHCHRGYLRL